MAATRIKRREQEALRRSSRCAIDKPKESSNVLQTCSTARAKALVSQDKLRLQPKPTTTPKETQQRYLKRTHEDLEDSHLEGTLWGWFRQRCAMGLRPSRTHVRTKAEQVAAHLGLTAFCPTDAWLDDFCLRHNFRCAGTSRENLAVLGSTSTGELLAEDHTEELLKDGGGHGLDVGTRTQKVLDAIRVLRAFALTNEAPTDIHDAVNCMETYVHLVN